MKFVLICIIFICITSIAIINLKYYKSKQKLLSEIIDFLRTYASEVSFNKASLIDVITKLSVKYSKNMKTLLSNYSNSMLYPSILNNNEKIVVSNIFNGMGKADVETEQGYINSAIEQMKTMLVEINNEYITKGVLRSKLIFIFGIILILILL